VRRERALSDELDFRLLRRWLLDMSLMEPSFDKSPSRKNRDRLLKQQVALQFFNEVVRQADALDLRSDAHLTVDEAAASLRSFTPTERPPSATAPDGPGSPTVNFHGEKRSNASH
jgi:hypothetical protein